MDYTLAIALSALCGVILLVGVASLINIAMKKEWKGSD